MAENTSVEDRQARVDEIDARLAEIDEEFGNTLMTDEVRDEWNRINGERDEHIATITEVRTRKERLQQVAGAPSATERATGQAPAFVRTRGDEIYDLTRIRAEARSDEDHRDKLHDNAKRAIDKGAFPSGDADELRGRVADLLERCDDASGSLSKRILATGSPVYDRAFGKVVMAGGTHLLSSEEQRTLALAPNTAGGFAVPFQLDPTILLTSDGTISPLRQISRVEQITTKTWQGITSEGTTVYRSLESATNTGNEFEVAQPTVSPTRVTADVRFSIEIEQDWAQLRSEITRVLSDAKDEEENTSFILGNGAGVQPGGVIATLPAGSVVDTATSNVFDVDDLYNLESELGPRFRSRARFLANKGTYNTIRAFASNNDGSSLWVRLAGGQPPELLGYPAHEASEIQDFGTGKFLLFGDFSKFLIVDRLGMNLELNAHVTMANGRWTGQRALVAAWRNSSKVLVDNAFRVLVEAS